MANKKSTSVKEAVAEKEITPVEVPAIEEPKYVIVTADFLNVRKEASTSSEVVVIVEKGTKLLTDKKIVSGFYSVETPDGIKGFVMKEFVTE